MLKVATRTAAYATGVCPCLRSFDGAPDSGRWMARASGY